MSGSTKTNRIDAALTGAPPGLWPFVPAGYPDLATTELILRRLAGVSIRGIELGFPFSDPIADGPVIQNAFTKALAAGVNMDAIFQMARRVRAAVSFPLVAMVSASIVYRIGITGFLGRAVDSGFDGLIVPDLSLEQAPELSGVAGDTGLKMCMLVAPTTSVQRQRRIATVGSGFLYYVSVQGVTGQRRALPSDLARHIGEIREAGKLPVLVGFGISTAAQVREVCRVADGAIVGSALVQRMTDCVEDGQTGEQIANEVAEFVAGLIPEN